MLCKLETAAIWGWHLFHSELPIVWLYCSRAASIWRNAVYSISIKSSGCLFYTHTHTSSQELGSFVHPCEGDLVCKGSNEKVPYFNAPLYLENKSQIGKVDDIFGPMQNYVSSVYEYWYCWEVCPSGQYEYHSTHHYNVLPSKNRIASYPCIPQLLLEEERYPSIFSCI